MGFSKRPPSSKPRFDKGLLEELIEAFDWGGYKGKMVKQNEPHKTNDREEDAFNVEKWMREQSL